jgi:hypothetical protein
LLQEGKLLKAKEVEIIEKYDSKKTRNDILKIPVILIFSKLLILFDEVMVNKIIVR